MKQLLALLILMCLCGPVSADEHTTHALTMHGTPQHGPDFQHYAFVNPDAPKGGVLKQSAIGTFDTLNPFTLKGKAAMGLSYVYDRLMDRSWDEPFTMYPLIARSVTFPDDRSAITFHLDPRARFQDKVPITSADVLYSFETLKEFGRPNMRRVYKLVDHVETPDPHTITFKLGAGYDRETIMILALMPVLPQHYWATRRFDAATLDPGVASGPYKIKHVEAGRRIIYERLSDYWARDLPVRRGQYNFDQIIYDYFRDEGVAFEAFKTGDLNIRREIDVTAWANAYTFIRSGDQTIRRNAIPHGRAEAVRGFIFNTRRPPFNDVRVREALSLAFDFTWVNKNLFSGQLKRTTSYFPNTDLAAVKNAWSPPPTDTPAQIRTNLQRADALLKSAGWIIKNGGRINAKTGTPFQFEILLGAPEDEKVALAFVRSLKRLGITPRTRTLDAAAFRDRTNRYDFDILYYFWLSTLSPGGEQLLNWGCQAAHEDGRFNYAGICDPLIDRLSSEIAQTHDRNALRYDAQALDRLLTFGFYTILTGYNPADLWAYNNQIHIPVTTPLYGAVPESFWFEPSQKPNAN